MKKFLLLLALLIPNIAFAFATTSIPWVATSTSYIQPNKINGVNPNVVVPSFLGISTSSPMSALTVVGATSTFQMAHNQVNIDEVTGALNTFIHINPIGTIPASNNYILRSDGTNLVVNAPAANQTGTINFRRGDLGTVLIDGSGNLGINTATPQALLDVNGTASTTQLFVGGTNATRLVSTQLFLGGSGNEIAASGANIQYGSPTNTGHFFYGGSVSIANGSTPSTTPYALLSVNPNGISGPAFTIGSSTLTNFQVNNGGGTQIIGPKTISAGTCSTYPLCIIPQTRSDGQPVIYFGIDPNIGLAGAIGVTGSGLNLQNRDQTVLFAEERPGVSINGSASGGITSGTTNSKTLTITPSNYNAYSQELEGLHVIGATITEATVNNNQRFNQFTQPTLTATSSTNTFTGTTTTLYIGGAPSVTASAAVSSSIGLLIDSGSAMGATTNASTTFGLYVYSPSGGLKNYNSVLGGQTVIGAPTTTNAATGLTVLGQAQAFQNNIVNYPLAIIPSNPTNNCTANCGLIGFYQGVGAGNGFLGGIGGSGSSNDIAFVDRDAAQLLTIDRAGVQAIAQPLTAYGLAALPPALTVINTAYQNEGNPPLDSLVTEQVLFKVNSNVTNRISTNIPQFRVSQFTQPTVTATTTNSVGTSSNAYIAGPVNFTGSAWATTTSGLTIDTGAAGNATTAQAILAYAPTGALNNYSAIFMGGNVGIASTSPWATLSVTSSTSTSGTVFAIGNTASTSLMVQNVTGWVGVNTTSPGAILDVMGDTIANSSVPAFRVALNAAKTEGISVTNPSGITRLSFLGTGSYIQDTGGLSFSANGGNSTFTCAISSATGQNCFSFSDSSTRTAISGTNVGQSMGSTFAPASGSGIYTELSITPTINQTGGANGITRGIYINPTLTSAQDFHAIEVTAGTSTFAIPVGIGTTTPATGYSLQVTNAGTTTADMLVGTPNVSGGEIIMVDATAGHSTCTQIYTVAGVVFGGVVTCPTH